MFLFSSAGDKNFQYCTCPAGPVTYNFHSSCKHMPVSFKFVCNKEHKGVICKMTSWSNSSQSTRPIGQVLLERFTRPFQISLVITIKRVEFLSPAVITECLDPCIVTVLSILFKHNIYPVTLTYISLASDINTWKV